MLFVFMRATTGRPYKNNRTLSLPVWAITYLRSKCAMKRSAILNRPYPCSLYLSASHKRTIAHKLCRGRRPRRPASLFALSFGFAQTNALSQTSVGEGLAPPVLCPLYFSASCKAKGLSHGERPKRKTLFISVFTVGIAPSRIDQRLCPRPCQSFLV